MEKENQKQEKISQEFLNLNKKIQKFGLLSD